MKKNTVYKLKRNKLIPKAIKIANEKAGLPPSVKKESNGEWAEWANRWNRYYHAAMNSLWQQELEKERKHE